jgi:hypothetical protein
MKKISLKKSGKKYVALCPFHKEKTPSFLVDLEKGFYKCLGCGKTGLTNEFEFVFEQEKSDLETNIVKPSDCTDDLLKLYNNEVCGDGPVKKIVIEDEHVVIKFKNEFEYEIMCDYLKTYKGIVGWIAHLNEKNWFTNDVLYCFLNVVNGHFNGIIDEAR